MSMEPMTFEIAVSAARATQHAAHPARTVTAASTAPDRIIARQPFVAPAQAQRKHSAPRCRPRMSVGGQSHRLRGESGPMRASKKSPGNATARHILVVDVGGMHVKLRIDARGPIHKFVSGPKMSPLSMMRRILGFTRNRSFDAVSIGYPGLVFHGRIAAQPHNLGKGWVGFDFGKAFGKPVKVINDAAMQAIGSYRGGRMLFLGLGTGLGVTIIIDGVVEPTEVGHMPYRGGKTFEQCVGAAALKRVGRKKWQRAVDDVLARLLAA